MARAKSTIGGRYPAGDYTEQVTVQAAADGSPAWVDVAAQVFARVEAIGPWQRLAAEQLQTPVDYRVALRGLSGTRVEPGMRILWLTARTSAAAVLLIRGAVDDGLDVVCECVEAHA